MIAVAGAFGALARYGVGVAFASPGSTSSSASASSAGWFPWPTLAINVVGSFLLGVVVVRGGALWPRDVTVALAVGFLGAFTTFSTFSFEVQSLLRAGRGGAALVYVALSVVVGVAAAALGATLFDPRSG